ncbi:hypothetical protein HRR83_001286 [Exophiala dermatitidis]|nr:hypothetical protein HRR74_001290 [Exophiala dermatitidis]KAJ4546814.1 hypothetical protein HRR77_004359 [Exophiala dermatitidis]KAJ4583928.1 hypothetical protein HRR82_003265 [Exophiala dermatitidis]KAJ4599675.1 hypothetical protein HRR84_003426 [Exophiala dermatitidis]KAJ4605324.1 hypothetical protein HRR83_001286 [Exophiala dermatitidis]
MRRIQGRVTRDDIRHNLKAKAHCVSQEPELCWPTGDCLVYLREPGQSSRGPAFRVHTAFLKVRGFDSLLDRCVTRNSVHATAQCVLPNCPGCDPHQALCELYIPAPHGAGLEEIFDHHIITRNFFAWLYNRPLTGRALGRALVYLKARIDVYRPGDSTQNTLEVVSYAENQRYLDFRECVDHALAALFLAETLHIEDLWVDSFAHCVGMSHRGLRSSIEYPLVSTKSKGLINRARQEMDLRLGRVHQSVADFFETEVTCSFLELPQPARDHLIKFRSFLKQFYVDKYGCWPPNDLEDEALQQVIYSTVFSEFEILYQYLVDAGSSTGLGESDIAQSGGICIHQVIQVFDTKHNHEPVAHPLPLLPKARQSSASQRQPLQRRMSWNPIQKRKADKEARKVQDKQALISATNRDSLVTDCSLVHKFSEFEERTVDDDLEGLSLVEGRKVRWLLIYAILQTFHAIAQPPQQVRNTANLTYSLCCQPPKRMPWQLAAIPNVRSIRRTPSELIPDTSYSHTNILQSSSTGENTAARSKTVKARRRTTLPAHLPGSFVGSITSKTTTTPTSPSSSVRRLMSLRPHSFVNEMPPKRAPFCEIFVEGYGNGLNEVNQDKSIPAAAMASTAESETTVTDHVVDDDRNNNEPHELLGESLHELPSNEIVSTAMSSPSGGSASVSLSVSRESSTSSTSSSSKWSKTSDRSDCDDLDPMTPASDVVCTLREVLQMKKPGAGGTNQASSLPDGAVGDAAAVDSCHDDPMQMPSVHFNTQTWDRILGQIPVSASASAVGPPVPTSVVSPVVAGA